MSAPSLSGPATQELYARYVVPTYGRFPLCLSRGEGARVWDLEGREYLDFGAGIAVCSVGHAHPGVTRVLAAQAARLSHTSNLYYTEPAGRLARQLVEECVGLPGRCFFCNSGAEANEALYKLARKFGHDTSPGDRFEIICFHGSFHGRTLAGIAATGQEKVRKGFAPATPGFLHATFNDLASVEAAVTPRTAAVLLEPIQGEVGVVPARADFLPGLRALCDRHDLLLMYDEIQCGLGRTGDWSAWRELGGWEARPDAVSWAKGIANGFPLGAVWIGDRPVVTQAGGKLPLAELLGPGSHGTTYGGNPLAAAVALETLRIIADEGLLANARTRGEEFRADLRNLRSPWVQEVRGAGLMIGLVLDAARWDQSEAHRAEPARPAAAAVTERMQAAGLLVVPSAPNVLRFLPPLNVSADEVSRAAEIVGRVLADLR